MIDTETIVPTTKQLYASTRVRIDILSGLAICELIFVVSRNSRSISFSLRFAAFGLSHFFSASRGEDFIHIYMIYLNIFSKYLLFGTGNNLTIFIMIFWEVQNYTFLKIKIALWWILLIRKNISDVIRPCDKCGKSVKTFLKKWHVNWRLRNDLGIIVQKQSWGKKAVGWTLNVIWIKKNEPKGTMM